MENCNIIVDLISRSITTNSEKNKFDILMQDIETYVESGTAHTMLELKEKEKNKKKKGDLFESFCYLYLQKILEHDEVWFYKDFPKELKISFHLTKNDYGIDLISRKGDGYYAIQCKYRRPNDKIQIISWKSLSTFYAMVSKSGPWIKHVTMTNVNGCRHIGEKTDKDWSIALGKFRGMDHFAWIKLCGQSPIEYANAITKKSIIEINELPDKEIIRNKRLAFYT